MIEKFVRNSGDDTLQYLPDRNYENSLDLGCGKGRFSQLMARFCENVYSIDIRKNQLSSFEEPVHNKIARLQSAGQYLPFPDDTFDLVVCYTVIEHIPEDENERFLNEIHRVLKKSGDLYIVNDAKFYRFLRKTRLLYPKRGPDSTHVNMITPKELETRLKDAGFKIHDRNYTPFANWSSYLNSTFLSPFALKGHMLCEKK